MAEWNRCFVRMAAMLVASCFSVGAAPRSTPMLDRLLAETREASGFMPVTPAQAEWAESLFLHSFRGDIDHPTVEGLTALGFETRILPASREQWRAILESEHRREGKGLYVLRTRAARVPVALGAPHRFYDRNTGTIAARLFEEHSFAAASWNSVPRQYEEGGRRIDADLARLDFHPFTAFTRAFTRAYPNGRMVQLHGFEQEKRRGGPANETDIIVSDGTKKPGAFARHTAACLRRMFPQWMVALFPYDVNELGGTTNRQGAAMRRLGSQGFLHLEMARGLRTSLMQDPAARAGLASCLLSEVVP